MADVTTLLDRLDAASDDEREEIWVGATAMVHPDDVRRAAREKRACLPWLVLRYDVGPPGRPLPPPDAARTAVLGGSGTAADAYAAVFTCTEVSDSREILPLLVNATAAVFSGGVGWLGGWIASRAALACLALGEPSRAWELLDVLSRGDQRHPEMEKVAVFLPIRGHADLELSPWVQGAVWWLWPQLRLRVVPVLPFPKGGDQPLAEALARLDDVGAVQVRELVQAFVQSMEELHADDHADEPLVRELERRALAGEGPPDVDALPDWFEEWARGLGRQERHRIAYLAGQVLHAHGHADAALVAMLIWPLARAFDLPILKGALGNADFDAHMDELGAAATQLGPVIGDALVAIALPRHDRSTEAVGLLLAELDALAALKPRPGGGLAHAVAMISEIAAARAKDHQEARPHMEGLENAVRRAAERLGDPRLLLVADVERVASSIAAPPISLGLLELSQEVELPALERLLQALVLLRAVEGTPHEPTWGPGFRRDASQAIWRLGVVRLFELRIRLLDELIAQPGPLVSLAELHFQRANSRRALQVHDDGAEREVVADLVAAAELAQRSGEVEFLADALAMLARVTAESDSPSESEHGAGSVVDILEQVDQVLELPVPTERRGTLLQAKAHLLRPTDPAAAAALLGDAIKCRSEDDPFGWEIGAEQILALVESGQVAAAVKAARALLGVVTERASDTVIAMVHHAAGYALEAAGDHSGAQAEYRHVLERTRGVDFRNEMATRIRLARLALLVDDVQQWRSQFAALRERWEELPLVMRRDVAGLAGEAAKRGFVDRASAVDLVEGDDGHWTHPSQAALAKLQHVRLALHEGDTVDLSGAFGEALPFADDAEVRRLMLELACDHGEDLDAGILERMLAHARSGGRPSAEARLLEHLGKVDAACAVLDEALSSDLAPEGRIACTHLLVTLLGEGLRDRRLGLCQELETLLAGEHDSATARIDLAACYRLLADGDRSLLERAWMHGTHALWKLRGVWNVAHGHRVVALVLADTVHAVLGRADPEVAERARWLLDDHPIEPAVLAEIRHAVSNNLLVLGPLCHPIALEVAEGLLALVVGRGRSTDAVATLQERVRWIRDLTSESPTGVPRPSNGIQGPADALPVWLVRLVADRDVRVRSEDVDRGIDVVALALHVRPDAADRILARLVRVQGAVARETRDAIFQLTHKEVLGPTVGTGAWTELEEALGSIKARKRHRLHGDIRAEIQRSRDGVPRLPDGPSPKRLGGRDYAEQAFDRAVMLMRVVHEQPFSLEAKAQIGEARELLSEAVDIARRKKMPQLSDFMISLGNAWKMPPDEDVEKALGIYEKVGRRDLDASQIAKLRKVQGDALRHRGRPEDLREAFDLLQRSARARSGWLRAESLLNAAGVARQHPDFDETERFRHAAELMIDAVRADANHVEDALEDLLMVLGEWGARAPSDGRPKAIREELNRRYPHRASDIELPVRLPPQSLREHILAMLTHPAGMAYMEVARRLMHAEQLVRAPFWLRRRLGKAAEEQIEVELGQRSLLGDPDAIARALADLDSEKHEDEAVPGVALARVRLLAELCRSGRESLDAVRDASRVARAEAESLPDPIVRSFLAGEHARIWCPHDHSDDRVRDFGLAAELARDAMTLEGGEEHATTDTLELVARALRYSPKGDIGANLAESRRLYAVLVERARAEGNADLAANALHCLAEAESQGADGDRLSRLRAGEAHIEASVRGASNPYKRAEYRSSLGWQRTQIALRLQGQERIEALRSALATFDEVDPSYLEEGHEHRNHRLNRTVCLGALERATKSRQAEVAVWREELAWAETEGHAHHVATIQHNLANALMIGADVAPDEVREGLVLCERAIKVRTFVANARHHWETTLLAGMGLSQALVAAAQGADIDLPWSLPLVWEKARSWLRKAVSAAKALGSGEELADAASELARLARLTPSTRDAVDVAEEGWSAMREAMPYLLFHPESAVQESTGALELALGLAWNLARQGPRVAVPGIAFAMDGDRARLVLRWLLRGFAPMRRPLTARLRRPSGVGLGTWSAWLSAIAERDPVAVTKSLKSVKAPAPDFLGTDPKLDATWRWLRAHPGAVAITVVLAQPVCLVAVLSLDGANRERVQVLGVPAPPPPVDDESLWGALSQSTHAESDAHGLHDEVAAWASKTLAGPVLRYLGTRPTAVLWCPGQTLRMVSPQAIWGDLPVATTAALALPDLAAAAGRGRSTLVALADPGKGALDLRGSGLPAVQRLLEAATERGDARALVSVGDKHGPAAGVARAVPGPASPSYLLERARDHDVLVVVAHGEAPAPESAALVLLDAAGEAQRLDVSMLAANPGAFTGATVLLLACESGRLGGGFHEPGGVAGALVAAGAKAVVAPLWPVRLDHAEQVAVAVLRGLAAGEEPFEVLARVQSSGDGQGPMLGPAPALDVQHRAATRHRQAFVIWVG
jgi:tetratricopeptide (TPR) repeat protein